MDREFIIFSYILIVAGRRYLKWPQYCSFLGSWHSNEFMCLAQSYLVARLLRDHFLSSLSGAYVQQWASTADSFYFRNNGSEVIF